MNFDSNWGPFFQGARGPRNLGSLDRRGPIILVLLDPGSHSGGGGGGGGGGGSNYTATLVL